MLYNENLPLKKKATKGIKSDFNKKIQMENLTLVVNKETQRELSKYHFANKIDKDFLILIYFF